MTLPLVVVNYCGRLGNRLFEYTLGRIIATELDCPLLAPPIPGFPAVLPRGLSRARQLPAEAQTLSWHRIPLDRILADRTPRRIILRGYFQRYEYYRPYKDRIRKEWLVTEAAEPPDPDDLTIHLRSGDIWETKAAMAPVLASYPALPYSFYAQIIEERRWKTVHIVSEDPDDPMARKLNSVFGARLQSSTAIADFLFIKSSQNIVLSISTFAWWAAWLSEASRIYYPVTGFFDPTYDATARPEVQRDVLVDDEERYLLRPISTPGRWHGRTEDRARLLSS